MPLLPSSYKPPLILANRHLQTILPSLLRRVREANYCRERIDTSDGDFLDLDWRKVTPDKQAETLVILSHGLEGNTCRHYIVGMAKAFNRQGVDALGWNFRTCSGETNRRLRFYHSGDTADLRHVIHHAENKGYKTIYLIGFSLGGNITLNLLGRDKDNIPESVKKAVVFSVPCDLKGASIKLSGKINSIYMTRFIRDLYGKLKDKQKRFPESVDLHDYQSIKTFEHFDNRYTAPMHGFKNAQDYWEKCSSKQVLPNIDIPTLLISAKDDPFLSESCFPYSEAKNSQQFYLEVPDDGGHVGFVGSNDYGEYWSEQRAVEFCLNSQSEHKIT